MKNFTFLTAACLFFLLSFNSSAQLLTNNLLFTAKLDGSHVTPPVETDAKGVATLSINGNRDTMCLNVTLSGMTDSITNVGIYNSAVDSLGELVIDFSSVISGNRLVASIVGTFLSAQNIADFINGDYSIRIATNELADPVIGGNFRLEADYSFMASLNGDQEVPASGSGGYGLALFQLNMDSSKLKINMMVDGITGPITGAHLHLGSEGITGPVAVDLTDFVTNEIIDATIDSSEFLSIVDSLMSGNVYINVHTAIYPNGEIRGQLHMDKGIAFNSYLTGEQEVPSVNTNAVGLAHLSFNPAMDSATYQVMSIGLSDTIIGAHLHFGMPGVSGPVVIDLSEGIDSFMLSGVIDSLSYTDTLLRDLLVGNIYVNLHTDENPNGEIRGQMRRYLWEGFTYSMEGAQENPSVFTTAMGGGFVAINPEGSNLHFMFAADNLSDTASAAHFHEGVPGEDGPAFFTLTPYLVQQINSTTGQGAVFAEGFWNDENNTPLDAASISLFTHDSVYINIHTPLAPGGEIRGQVMHGTECFSLFTGVQDAYSIVKANVTVYPNPAATFTTLSIFTERSGENTEIRLYDLLGNLLWSYSIKLPAGLYQQELDLNEYSPGIYFIEVRNGDQSIVSKLEKL